ncbi:Uncharacterised protein [Mycobacterium tuberculosis]|uniref:Uncharacterized protein n=1 Tax=Mycobacterium tuberculosis TaxID=1773 RepID=A0A0U0SWS4_MYCTX|nr:Uncharacterised protein [Mycobacterium tuberculosis]COX08856.1 Uncharacterised protein [Mycobacterium tuberculosis]COX30973.1 Uncharacterised protein [Mycobacterium tuberculosis]
MCSHAANDMLPTFWSMRASMRSAKRARWVPIQACSSGVGWVR